MLRHLDELDEITVVAGERELHGSLGVPPSPLGLVIIASGDAIDGDDLVAEALRARGLATVTAELETDGDLEQLASDLVAITEWSIRHATLSSLPMGYLAADVFAAAAILAATRLPELVRAIVTLGGRIDTAGDALATVRAPTLLVCGRDDEELIERDREAIDQMTTTTQLAIIPGVFDENIMLREIVELSAEWLVDHFRSPLVTRPAGSSARSSRAGSAAR